MGNGSGADHFIPVSQHVLMENLLTEDRLTFEEKRDLKRFYDILRSLMHFEFHTLHEGLKENYHIFDPDPITPPPTDVDRTEAISTFDRSFSDLMDRANFTSLTKAELDEAFSSDTPLAVNVSVDLSDYEILHLFSRGRSRRMESAPFMYIFKRKFEVELYDRLVMFAKFAPPKKKRKRKTTLGMVIDESKVFLKYFKNVPIPDIEMIFPDPKIKMTFFDRFKITALILAPLAIAGSQIASLAGGNTSQSLLTGLAVVIGGYAVKSIISYHNTRMKYIKNLTQGLYFKNLDNNSGVFDAVINEAEEEEVKETILAYYFLHAFGPMGIQTLDKVVEEWFRVKLNITMDFEVDDALAKLERLKLASEGADGKWQVIPLPKTLERLDYLWDNFFEYNKPVVDETPITDYQEHKPGQGDVLNAGAPGTGQPPSELPPKTEQEPQQQNMERNVPPE